MARRRYYRRSYRRGGSKKSSSNNLFGINPMFIMGAIVPFLIPANSQLFEILTALAVVPVKGLGPIKKISQGFVLGQIIENRFGNPLQTLTGIGQ